MSSDFFQTERICTIITGKPDLFAIGDDDVVALAVAEAVPREQETGAADSLESEPELARGLECTSRIDDIGIEVTLQHGVVSDWSTTGGDVIVECQRDLARDGEEDSATAHRA
jgi:hypothetical protein